jgi:hypothetical protein
MSKTKDTSLCWVGGCWPVSDDCDPIVRVAEGQLRNAKTTTSPEPFGKGFPLFSLFLPTYSVLFCKLSLASSACWAGAILIPFFFQFPARGDDNMAGTYKPIAALSDDNYGPTNTVIAIWLCSTTVLFSSIRFAIGRRRLLQFDSDDAAFGVALVCWASIRRNEILTRLVFWNCDVGTVQCFSIGRSRET